MVELSEEDRKILEVLHEKVSGGEAYVRAKNIASQLGLSSKQVGARLPKLAEDEAEVDVEIEKWGRARSTTWRVTRG
ncbi:MAG: DNA-binding Lrp family transcriptional regulator [Natronomonas sp.]|jgi:DNA-binding Lrp family transcriptional regulator